MQAPDWDDPLPHALQPALAYLSRPTPRTRAAVVLLHGRGDNAADFADAFLPALHRCFGGAEERLEEGDEASSDVAVISLAAADGIWYPESHSVTKPEQLEYNGPYVYSSLLCLQKTLGELAECGVPPTRVVVVGFSQGANLANTYMLCALREPDNTEVLRPAYVLALAGTRLASLPPFPRRAGTFTAEEAQRSAPPSSAVPDAEHTFVRLICGEGDRYFRPAEIHAVAGELAQAGVRVSVALEPGVGHIVTPRMVAAVIEAAQELCAQP